MAAPQPSTGELADRITRALANAEVGQEVLATDLTDLESIDVRVAGDEATVTVTLPVPAVDARAAIRREITRIVRNVEEVSEVECRFSPEVPDLGARVDFIPDVKNVIAVASGKGGVGKSTVAVNLATALADAGTNVGLLDADIYGPNAPTMLGLEDRTPDSTLDDGIVPREAHQVRVMSMDFIVGEEDPVIWRGPMVDEFIKQMFADVEWGALDYLIVDLPPGTGDAQLSLVQHLPVTGAVIVTTPEPVATDDARRGLRGFRKHNVPILGIVENMGQFECPDCGSGHDIFDGEGGKQLASDFGVPILGQLPIDPAVGTLDGEVDPDDPPGVSIPGIGRLQLPRVKEERERPTSLPPMAVRDGGGSTSTAFGHLATRTAARLHQLVIDQED